MGFKKIDRKIGFAELALESSMGKKQKFKFCSVKCTILYLTSVIDAMCQQAAFNITREAKLLGLKLPAASCRESSTVRKFTILRFAR